jgi:hypothetical protein
MAKKAKTLIYVTGKKYDGMMGRCYRETDASYKNYGGKNIRMCKDWIVDINNFRSWVIKQLLANNIDESDFVNNSNKYQIDRIDPKGHYTPENCRLVNPQANTRNRSVVKGKQIISAEGDIITFGE